MSTRRKFLASMMAVPVSAVVIPSSAANQLAVHTAGTDKVPAQNTWLLPPHGERVVNVLDPLKDFLDSNDVEPLIINIINKHKDLTKQILSD